jgi:hypothetical protein
VTLTASPASAIAYRHGEPVRLPASFDVEKGPIELDVRAEGYVAQKLQLDGTEPSKHVDLVRAGASLAPAAGAPSPAASVAWVGPTGTGSRPITTALIVAKQSAGGCARHGGPAGSGKVRVTFTPSGVASAQVQGAPFAGTAVGRCVEGVFRSVRFVPMDSSPAPMIIPFDIPEAR